MFAIFLKIAQATSSACGAIRRSSIRKAVIGAPQGCPSIRRHLVLRLAAPRTLRSVPWASKCSAAVVLVLAWAFGATSALAQSAIPLEVVLETGNDDFREASTLSITMRLTDGTVSFPAQIVSRRKLESHSRTVVVVAIRFPISPGIVTAALVRDFTLTFTGDKRPGMPSDEDDSWNLDSISMGFMPDPRAQLVYNSAFDSSRSMTIAAGAEKMSRRFMEFTGRNPYIAGPIPVNAVGTATADLTITRISKNQKSQFH